MPLVFPEEGDPPPPAITSTSKVVLFGFAVISKVPLPVNVWLLYPLYSAVVPPVAVSGVAPVDRDGVLPSAPVPMELIAATVKLYEVLCVSPVAEYVVPVELVSATRTDPSFLIR